METEVKDKLHESEFYFEKGQSYSAAGSFDLAISCFEECIRIGHPYFKASSLVFLAEIYRKLGDQQNEAAVVRRVVELPPEEKKFVSHFTLGVMLTRLGDLKGAESAYRRGIEVSPSNMYAAQALNLAEVEIMLGNHSAASELLGRLSGANDRKVVLLSKFLLLASEAIQNRSTQFM